MTTGKPTRLYLSDLEPIDLTETEAARLTDAGHIFLGHAGEARLHAMLGALIYEARSLLSEDGENREYDRALVELVGRFGGYGDDDRALVEHLVYGDEAPMFRSAGPA